MTSVKTLYPNSASTSGCHHCGEEDAHERWNRAARGETPLQRLDRAYAELLQEIRVAQTGVQILLAFLLTIAFTPRFPQLIAETNAPRGGP
jgi:hypothetical protein